MSELVKVKRTKGKENHQKQNQREIKPNHQIPRVRQEANREGGQRRRSIPDCCSEPLFEPNDKTSRFDVSDAPFSQRTSTVTQHLLLLKQGRGERNGAPEEKTLLNLI